MAMIQVTAAELRSKAEELRGMNGQLKSQIGKLETDEQALSAMWEGEAQRAFRMAFQNDKGQMDSFTQLMEQYCRTMENIAAKYEMVESQNVQTASKRTY